MYRLVFSSEIGLLFLLIHTENTGTSSFVLRFLSLHPPILLWSNGPSFENKDLQHPT